MKLIVSWGLVLAAVVLVPLSAPAKIGGGDIEFKPKGAGKVVFRHEIHVTVKGMRCNNCHYGRFQMGGSEYKMDMATLTKGHFCGGCHDGNKGFDLKAGENCKRCHQD